MQVGACGLWGRGGQEERERRKCVCGVCVCAQRVHVSSLTPTLLSQKALSEGEFASRAFFCVLLLVVHQGAVQAGCALWYGTVYEGSQWQCVLGGAQGTECGPWVCEHQ